MASTAALDRLRARLASRGAVQIDRRSAECDDPPPRAHEATPLVDDHRDTVGEPGHSGYRGMGPGAGI
jgi:hypothetical protein